MNFFLPEESILEICMSRERQVLRNPEMDCYCSRPTDSSDVHIMRIPYSSYMQESPNVSSFIRTLMISDTEFVRL